jgi:dienelactone hydrolase
MQCAGMAQNRVTTSYGQWQDTRRQRSIPYKLYRPGQLEGIYPVVIFSHGLGGSTEAAPYLGEYLAAHGYICFFVQHGGSDDGLWKGKPLSQIKPAVKASLQEPENFINRMEDIPFVVSQLPQVNAVDAQLKGHLNLDAVGMAGHSYGARSTMIAAGEKISGTITKYKVPEIRAGVVLSPNTPERVRGNLADYYTGINIPLFHITGTRDDDNITGNANFDPVQRTIPYQNIGSSPQYLLVLDGANHMDFGGGGSRRKFAATSTSRYVQAVQQGVLAFLDAYLKGNGQQKDWLRNKYKSTLEKSDRFEWKE